MSIQYNQRTTDDGVLCCVCRDKWLSSAQFAQQHYSGRNAYTTHSDRSCEPIILQAPKPPSRVTSYSHCVMCVGAICAAQLQLQDAFCDACLRRVYLFNNRQSLGRRQFVLCVFRVKPQAHQRIMFRLFAHCSRAWKLARGASNHNRYIHICTCIYMRICE